MKLWKTLPVLLVLVLTLLLSGCSELAETPEPSFDLDSIPEYAGEPFVRINNNVPDFSADGLSTESYEHYGRLDFLGRCTVASANIGPDLLPTEERGSISHIKPTGWQIAKYDFVDGKYLYNRCHLIAFQLTGENDNEQNLITGTRYMNTEMTPFENMVADYIRETGNHVRYRVTPVYDGENPVASGVQMEAMSVEDNGEAIMFNVYLYNIQPGVTIDYETGNNWLENGEEETEIDGDVRTYILNTSSGKFHDETCSSVGQIKDKNKAVFTGTRNELLNAGYEPCGNCHP